MNQKIELIREPCDWWFHSGTTVDDVGNQIPKGPSYCANKKSANYLSRVCPTQSCDDYELERK